LWHLFHPIVLIFSMQTIPPKKQHTLDKNIIAQQKSGIFLLAPCNVLMVFIFGYHRHFE